MENLTQFISSEAKPGKQFKVKLKGNIDIANGEWLKVENNQIAAKITGEVPVLKIPFDVVVTIIISGEHATITLNGNANAKGNGQLHQVSTDELKIINLAFDDEHFNDITEISLTRWKHVETRASIYKNPILKFGWLETWWV